MGARRLRDWLSQPLADADAIRRRQESVQTWMQNTETLEKFRAQLTQVRDLERTIGRLSAGSGNARDLLALRVALEQLPSLKQILAGLTGTSSASLIKEEAGGAQPIALLPELESQLVELPDLVELIARAISEEPPLALKEGGLIRDGFDSALDELRAASRSGKDWIAKLQQDEIERTGIASLKVRFNSVFGYPSRSRAATWTRCRTLYPQADHRERAVHHAQLKEMEGKVLGAEERSIKLEYELFLRVREAVLARLPEIQRTAGSMAQLDVLASFAATARLYNYCRPQVGAEGMVTIRDGRHPVLEQNLNEERFVPNDTGLASSAAERGLQPASASESESPVMPPEGRAPIHPQIGLITGPNMAGKSTYIRQVALLVLLAHTGSFIPAAEACIDLVDSIFTRIGASYDITRGQSTFMVEMRRRPNPEQRH
jgi:DNA mismatch repair protein MutS